MIKWTWFVLEETVVGHHGKKDEEGAALHFQSRSVALQQSAT